MALALALGASASPAGAVLVPNPTTTPGAVPQWAVMPMMTSGGSGTGAQAQISGHGGAVLGATNVYAIYWDPTSPPSGWPVNYPVTTKALTAEFLNDLAADSHMLDSPFAVNGQYVSGGNAAGNTAGSAGGYEMNFAGAYTDQVTPYPQMGQPGDCSDPNTGSTGTDYCLTDAQIQGALETYINAYALPTGPTNVYLVLTPPDVTTCLDSSHAECSDVSSRSTIVGNQDVSGGYCGYHSVIRSGSSEIVYGQIPWLYPKIPAADFSGAPPPAAVVNDLKNCQPDGDLSSDQTAPAASTTTTTTTTSTTSTAVVPTVNVPNGEPLQPQDENLATISVDFGDVLANVINHVLNGIITDPNLNGWYDSGGLEAPDKCEAAGVPPGAEYDAFEIPADFTPSPVTLPFINPPLQDPAFQNYYDVTLNGGDKFYLQAEFNATHATPPFSYGDCAVNVQLLPAFPAPSKVAASQLIGFDPSETLATLGLTKYVWNFGDGSPNAVVTCPTQTPAICNPSTFHAFTTPGNYTVSLTVTDGAGNIAAVSHIINVPGAVPAATGPPAAGPGSTAGGAAAGSPTATGSAAPLVPPLATQAIVASSVAKALKSGLLVQYSVTEKVAGHFEVLLDAKTAKRLKITKPVVKGVKVDGLANPVEVGTALLLTTKGGKSDIKITFSKSAAAKLRQEKTLSLTVRLVASNIAGQQVVVTTTVKLH